MDTSTFRAFLAAFAYARGTTTSRAFEIADQVIARRGGGITDWQFTGDEFQWAMLEATAIAGEPRQPRLKLAQRLTRRR